MCSRYRLLDAADIQPRDVYPSQLAPVQTRDGVRDMRWGFAGRTGKGLLINARAETAADKPTFSTALQQTRCVIAASAFYEWNAQKQAFLFENAAEDTPLYLAGLYTQDTDGQERFVILTREANDAVSPVHPRMPCLLPNVEYCHQFSLSIQVFDHLAQFHQFSNLGNHLRSSSTHFLFPPFLVELLDAPPNNCYYKAFT